MPRRAHRPLLTLALLVPLGVLVALGGCTIPGLPGSVPSKGPTPSSKFQTAPTLTLDGNGDAEITNTLQRGDVHVFAVGPLQPGDRVVVDVSPTSASSLDPTAALFDANGDLFTVNDDIDTQAGQFQTHIDEVIRAASSTYYLAIAPSFFGTTSGSYNASVHVERGGPVVAPSGQVVYLNFDGGHAVVPNVGTYELPAFDAARIDARYAGSTDLIRQTIVDTVRASFDDLNVTTLDSTVSPRPDTPYNEVFFGGFSRDAFGISENVDHWNHDKSDRSIIFTDHFDDPFAVKPSAAGIGVAIGNVAAHEIGHLLGLEHTADITDLMDTTGSASTLLADQTFKDATLDKSVFPIGDQNGLAILTAMLGMKP